MENPQNTYVFLAFMYRTLFKYKDLKNKNTVNNSVVE